MIYFLFFFVLLFASSVHAFDSDPKVIEQMLDLAKVTKSDTVYDLGSGDGRIVIAAAKRGARAIGIENDPKRVELSLVNIKGAKVSAEIRKGDFFLENFSNASVVTLYVGNATACLLKSKLQALRRRTRIVANGHGICDWTPTRISGRTILWVLP